MQAPMCAVFVGWLWVGGNVWFLRCMAGLCRCLQVFMRLVLRSHHFLLRWNPFIFASSVWRGVYAFGLGCTLYAWSLKPLCVWYLLLIHVLRGVAWFLKL